MNFKENLVGLLIIVVVFVSYHLLQPMGDGFYALDTSHYALKKHGVDDENKHAKFKDKKDGLFHIHAGDSENVRGTLSFKSSGQLLMNFTVSGGEVANLVLKHNDEVMPTIRVKRGKPKNIHLAVMQGDDVEIIAENNEFDRYKNINAKLTMQGLWFDLQNQLIPFLWAILFIFLWGKRHVFTAINTFGLFLLMLMAQKMNFGMMHFQEVLVYMLLSFALAFSSVLIHQELVGFRRYRLSMVVNTLLAFIVYIIPISFIIYVWNFNAKVSKDILFAVFQSNGEESLEYLSDFVDLQYIGLFVLLAAVIGFLLHKQELKETFKVEKSLLLLMSITFFTVSLTQLSVVTLPRFISDSFEKYNHELQLFRSVQAKRKAGEIKFVASKEKQGEIFIVVIGESLNKKNMGLYDYVRDTTPQLSKLQKAGELLVFQNAYANYSYTIKALQLSLTEANQYNKKNYYDSLSIVDVLKQAGVETHWLTNQVIYGGWDNMISVIANESNHLVALNHTIGKHTRTQHYDGALVDELNKILAQKTDKNRVIFVHLMGNHGSYSSRYPDEFSRYKDRLDRALFGGLAGLSTAKQNKINHYDNSIEYNDDVVSRLIALAKQDDGVSGLLYMPDHADDALGGKGHSSSKFNFHMLQIPMMAWFSDEYKATYPNTYLTLSDHQNTIFSNDLLYDTVLGLMHINTDRYEANHDLSSSIYALDAHHALALHGKKKFIDKTNYIWWQKQNAEVIKKIGQQTRILPHKVNSLGKLKDIWADGLRSFEMDIWFDEASQKFRVGNKKSKLGDSLVGFLSHVPSHEIEKVWVEFNNLSGDNILAARNQLNVLDAQFKLKQKLIIESDSESVAFKTLADNGWKTIYYLPTHEITDLMKSGNQKSIQDRAKKLAVQIKKQHISGLSFDGQVYDFVKRYLEPKLANHIGYYVWFAPALKDPNFKTLLPQYPMYQDGRVKVLLSKYKSSYD
ncbi:MAG: phosphoethanolamine transferase [Ghiorsea sp.]